MTLAPALGLAQEGKSKENAGMHVVGLIGSLGEVAAGAGIIWTGAGTVPGAILLGKGAGDTVVAIRNIVKVKRGEESGAKSALGEVCGAGARLLKKDDKGAKYSCDVTDVGLSIFLGAGAISKSATIASLFGKTAVTWGGPTAATMHSAYDSTTQR